MSTATAQRYDVAIVDAETGVIHSFADYALPEQGAGERPSARGTVAALRDSMKPPFFVVVIAAGCAARGQKIVTLPPEVFADL